MITCELRRRDSARVFFEDSQCSDPLCLRQRSLRLRLGNRQIPGSPGATATEIYLGLQAQRKELGSQLENLEDKRRDLSQRLRSQW